MFHAKMSNSTGIFGWDQRQEQGERFRECMRDETQLLALFLRDRHYYSVIVNTDFARILIKFR